MGMGEPLDNYNAVITAIRGMTDVQRFSLGYGQISVSTVGVAPRIRQLADDAPHVNLALSLHAPNQKLRTEIVPSSKAWHINKIVEALDYFIQCQNAVSRREKNTLVECVPRVTSHPPLPPLFFPFFSFLPRPLPRVGIPLATTFHQRCARRTASPAPHSPPRARASVVRPVRAVRYAVHGGVR